MYISLFDDPELKEKEAILDALNKPILEKANNLNWFERNFTNKYDQLTDELRNNWYAFNAWHESFLRRKSREFTQEAKIYITSTIK